MSTLQRNAVSATLEAAITERVEALAADLESTRAARDADSKSTAGDKHETGRAMAQQAVDHISGQLAAAHALLQAARQLPLPSTEQAGLGSLVHTDKGSYFLALAWGRLKVDGSELYVISPASPVGSALLGAVPGQRIRIPAGVITVTGLG